MGVSPVTLRDVAKRAEVHPSTASRALNERTRDKVSAAAVQRVLEAARQLGYRPNSLARGLKLQQTFTIGMLLPDLTNPLFPPMVRGIEDILVEAGYTLVLANTDNSEQKEAAIIEAMERRRVDGLIVATARRDYPLIDRLVEASMPMVLINRTLDDPTVSSVAGNDHAGIGLALRHLAALGHRRIAHVAGTQTVSTGLDRYHAFLAWMMSLDLELDHGLIVFADQFREREGAAAFAELLRRRDDFTAVVAANDLVALGCYDVCRERGIAIPGHLSVVGYNDMPFCDQFAPPLTSVRIPHYRIGAKAAELLLDAVMERDPTAVAVRLIPTLSVRASTGPPRSG
ncbi:MAG TPA: LacI family DNA-binding transcriptional regulator [Actinomycetes bacterium]|jgi:LacI family transcriptional regulator|nr:LacI family DNA-binding transcriptional regulator [Actinomycetes bacterium]